MFRRRRRALKEREHAAASRASCAPAPSKPLRQEAAAGSAASLLRLHRDFGNRGVQRMLRAGGAAAVAGCGFGRQSGKGATGPLKANSELADDVHDAKPDPKNGSATIKCDGAGDYEILYGSYENATCGTKGCVTKHESSHMADWKAKWPKGCKDQPKGYLPKGDPPDEVLMTVAEYNAFLKQSECKAHTVDLDCANALPQPAACEQTVKDYIKLTSDQKKNWC